MQLHTKDTKDGIKAAPTPLVPQISLGHGAKIFEH
jgi:hypothetical protein